MIKQITEKSIGHRIRFHFFYSTERWMFFEIDKMPANAKSLAEFLENISNGSLPKGIYLVEIVEENKNFMVLYNETEITEEKVIEFAESLGL